jgi:3-phenylpropionate/trans-cinnamate dioxygenase ferredoxin subunit
MSWLTGRLTRLLQERTQSVETVARQLGIERSRLGNIIAGSAIPNESLTKRLAKHFDEAPDEWLANVSRPEDAQPATIVPPDFFKVARAADIPNGGMKIVFNSLVVVAKIDGHFFAFGNVCPHAAGPIGEGFLDGCEVECPWHTALWDVTTGKALNELATADIPLFAVRVIGDDVEIKLTPAVLTQGVVSNTGPGPG